MMLKASGTKIIEYLNIAKGIAIIAVVIGHAESPIRNFLYLFHVPLFFLVSGYLYKEEYSSKPLTLIYKRIKTLFIPFLIAELIYFALHNIFFNIHFYSEVEGLNTEPHKLYSMADISKTLINMFTFGTTEPLLVPLWFLTSLFTVNVLFCLISYFYEHIIQSQNEFLRGLIVLIFTSIGFLLTSLSISLPRLINTSLVALLFFYTGFIFKQYWKDYKFGFGIAFISIVVLVINSFFVKVEMVMNNYSNIFLFLINAFFGIYMVLFFSQKLTNAGVSKVLGYIGNNSLYILILHLTAFKIIHLIQIVIYNYPIYYLAKITGISSGNIPWWILYGIIGVLLPLLFPLALNRITNLHNTNKS